jgi:putative transposase
VVRYRRNFLPGGTFFFTVTLDDRSSSALIDHIGLLRAAFRGTRNLKPFAIDAIADFSDRWRRINGAFTRGMLATGVSVPRNHRGEYAIWQRRFWEHTVRNDEDFERCTDYIHFNPVKHGLVSSPVAWPFSSLHRYIRSGVLPRDWGEDSRVDNTANFGERAE